MQARQGETADDGERSTASGASQAKLPNERGKQRRHSHCQGWHEDGASPSKSGAGRRTYRASCSEKQARIEAAAAAEAVRKSKVAVRGSLAFIAKLAKAQQSSGSCRV